MQTDTKKCHTGRLVGFFLSSLVVCALIVQAQINTGRISGVVSDASGSAVPGAAIRAVNQASGVVTTAATGSTGDYLLNFLVPGQYRVEVEKEGFQKSIQTGVTVNAGGIAHLDITLQVGEVT